MKQIEKDALRYDGFSYNGCPDHPSGADRWTSNGYGIHVEPNTPEQQAIVDQLNAEFAGREIPLRDGVFLNRAYVEQFPREQRLKLWKDEYIQARRLMRCKGKRASVDEYNRMTYAAMMWKREESCGEPYAPAKVGTRLPGDPI